jgi:hypothetical protein
MHFAELFVKQRLKRNYVVGVYLVECKVAFVPDGINLPFENGILVHHLPQQEHRSLVFAIRLEVVRVEAHFQGALVEFRHEQRVL